MRSELPLQKQRAVSLVSVAQYEFLAGGGHVGNSTGFLDLDIVREVSTIMSCLANASGCSPCSPLFRSDSSLAARLVLTTTATVSSCRPPFHLGAV